MVDEPDSAILRKGSSEDSDAILALLNRPAANGLILPRTREEIAAAAENFVLAEKNRKIVGCVTLKDYGQGLFEIRSLVVAPEARNHGLGSQLIEHAVGTGRNIGANRIFALTYRPRLFERLGFKRVPKKRFPQKVWDDCRRCAKRDHCDEIALLLQC